jgi:GMP synthase (glutamine-hydrolysing)
MKSRLLILQHGRGFSGRGRGKYHDQYRLCERISRPQREEAPLFLEMGSTISLFKWYNQSMKTSVPQNCILLATSSECVVEAFTVKGRPHIVGLQCDNHAAHPDDVRRWMENLPPERISGRVLLDQAEKSFRSNQEMFRKLIANFMLFTKR